MTAEILGIFSLIVTKLYSLSQNCQELRTFCPQQQSYGQQEWARAFPGRLQGGPELPQVTSCMSNSNNIASNVPVNDALCVQKILSVFRSLMCFCHPCGLK